MDERLIKLREERIAREKARIEKLRELNLKKYSKIEDQVAKNPPPKLVKSNSVSQVGSKNPIVKNNFHVNGNTKRPITAPVPKKPVIDVKTNVQKNEAKNMAPKAAKIVPTGVVGNVDKIVTNDKSAKSVTNIKKPGMKSKIATKIDKSNVKTAKTNNTDDNKIAEKAKNVKVLAEIKPYKKIEPRPARKSIAVLQKPSQRKSMMPNIESYTQESVFDRLYKPKSAPMKTITEVQKLQNPTYLKKVIKNSDLILKRHTCFETKVDRPVRRSISAVHFKRISKNELPNCMHKWSSIGDKLNKQHLTENEDKIVEEDHVVSAVKSECKKVKFMTPMSHLNTPRPEDLQIRLKAWLQKRGKSLNAYQHLQCFGINHLARTKFEPYNDENKENIALDSDSDDGSYAEIMNEENTDEAVDVGKWRQTSFAESDSNETVDFNETTVTSADTYVNVDDLLTGALNDLAELLKEGYDAEQSARYLRLIRERFPAASRTAAYWECRAALEERRGDLHASVECWEQAIAKGTEYKVVEANLDTLLNKFMQLKISPNSASTKRPDPKMVDVKNVFKSTIIRFAVQQAKLRQSETPVFTVTPVRRSGRLSQCPTPRVSHTPRLGNRTPLRLFDSVRQVTTPQHVFKNNDNLVHTP